MFIKKIEQIDFQIFHYEKRTKTFSYKDYNTVLDEIGQFFPIVLVILSKIKQNNKLGYG